MHHKPGVEVRPGVFTTQDPKFDFDINIKRLVNSGHGRPIPDDVPVFALLGHDLASRAAVERYLVRVIDLGCPATHTASVAQQLEVFTQFHEENPGRMKLAQTPPRPQEEHRLLG